LKSVKLHLGRDWSRLATSGRSPWQPNPRGRRVGSPVLTLALNGAELCDKRVKDLLGHASFSTTEKHYIMAQSRVAGRALARAIEGRQKRAAFAPE
jgi:hypothetical protein